jgi:RHS repeat-associated protein
MSLKLPSGRTGVFITDPQLRGTVRAIADADKNATNVEFKTYDISPWGEVAADTGSLTRLRLAGQQYDQGARLYYMRARYYDPQLGRFLSEDPIGVVGGLNLYAYAGNDPVNLWDPSGTSETGPGSMWRCTTPDGLAGWTDRPGGCIPEVVELPDINVSNSASSDQGPPGIAGFDNLFSDPTPTGGPVTYVGGRLSGVLGVGAAVAAGSYETDTESGIYFQLSGLTGVDIGPSAEGGWASSLRDFRGTGVQYGANVYVGASFTVSGDGRVTSVGGSLGLPGVSAGVGRTVTLRTGPGRLGKVSFQDAISNAMRDATTFFSGVGWN